MRIKSQIGGIGHQSSSNPGPGQYQSGSKVVEKSIAYSFGIKTGSSLGKKGLAPGPG